MKRFILLSFIFLGLGFYELSGGADFDPAAARAMAVEARMERSAERNETIVASLTQPVTSNTAARPAPDGTPSAQVTRASLDLVSFETVSRPEPAVVQAAAQAPVASAPAREPASPPIEELATRAAETGETLSLAALDSNAEGGSGVAFAGNTLSSGTASADTRPDIRAIKGTLVNMRSGPGTDYDVIDQLTQSTEVEVLASNGSGWVELRRLDGNETGWIAEFLLTAR